jgi:membrane-associated phospholipid phosphatase
MYNNKHWFSDVVAGAGIGILSTKFSYLIYPQLKRLFKPLNQPNTAFMPTYQNKLFGVSYSAHFKF